MDIGQMLNDFWAQWGVPIVSFLTSSAVGSIIVAIAWKVFSKLLEKNKPATLSDTQVDVVSTAVANKLANKVIDVDVSKVVTDATKEELSELLTGVNELVKLLKNQNASISLMGAAMSRSKLMTDEEKAALTKAINNLPTEQPKEKIKVELTANTTTDSTASTAAAQSKTIPLGG